MTPSELVIRESVTQYKRRLNGPGACDAYVAARTVVDHILKHGPGMFDFPARLLLPPELSLKCLAFQSLVGFGNWRRNRLKSFMKRYK
ncbi:hypothetical protein Gekk315_00069 [Aeromonas phage Gekk3-15]